MRFEIYQRYENLMKMEYTILEERLEFYWNKIKTQKMLPEDRTAIVAVMLKLEAELVEKKWMRRAF